MNLAAEAVATTMPNRDRVLPGQCRQTVGVIIALMGGLPVNRTAINMTPVNAAAATRQASRRLRIEASGMAFLRWMTGSRH